MLVTDLLLLIRFVSLCVAAATVSDQAADTGATHDAQGETTAHDDSNNIMPEINTPNISLEVSETAKHDSTVVTEDHDELSVAATAASQEHDGLEIETQPENEIPVPKPPPQEEVSAPKLQTEDQSTVQKPIPEPRSSSLSASGDAFSLQGRMTYPKPVPGRSKPVPAPRPKPAPRKGKLLPLREKLADNANKLVECTNETSFVPTAEWVSNMTISYCKGI